jgi:lipopolysaccharide export system permease protein
LQGRGLTDIFIHERNKFGPETTVSARSGYIETDTSTDKSLVYLSDATIINSDADRAPLIIRVRSFVYKPDFTFQAPAFRARGGAERELTLGELWEKQADAGSGDAQVSKEAVAQLSAEANGRLVRSISVAAMPFLAVPMGIAAKRSHQAVAIAVGSVCLVAYHFIIEMGQGLVAHGTVSPLLGMWVPFAIFATLSIYLFYRVDQQPRPKILETIFENASDTVGAALKKAGLAKLVSK